MGLNENQHRGVTVTFRLLEEQIAEFEGMMRDAQGILYRRVANFTPEQRTRMVEIFAAMREEVRRAARQFDLPMQERNAAQEIAGSAWLLWETLEEIRSHRLRGYGTVDPTLAETLDPIVERLIQMVFELENVVKIKE